MTFYETQCEGKEWVPVAGIKFTYVKLCCVNKGIYGFLPFVIMISDSAGTLHTYKYLRSRGK